MYENTYPDKRFAYTLAFLKQHVGIDETILDLGVENPFSKIMIDHGYSVTNTTGEDLDTDLTALRTSSAKVLTAFEIFEHLLAPFNLLRESKANKLVASVPLKLWFSSAYQNKNDHRDRHYHEFEDWQFDWLLEKSGWHIIDRIKFTNPVRKIGIRPLLRKFTPRYYLIYAEKGRKTN